jgi:putative transcriptional regulator
MSIPLAPGQLLVAAPAMTDPNFAGTVLLLCAVEKSGAVGLVLNRPLGIPLEQVLPAAALPPAAKDALLWGGPVGSNQIHLLHQSPLSAEIGRPVSAGLHFGGGLEDARRIAAADGRLLYFVGYSGWGEDQLEEEIGSGSWLILPADADAIWKSDRAWQWEELIARAAPELAWMKGSNRPEVN